MATLVAGLRGRRLRPARLCEPQLHCLIRRPILSGSGCGVRPGHRRCPAAGPAVLRTAKARPLPLRYEVRPRRAPLAPLWRRCARGRRPKGRKSTAHSPTKNKAQSSPQFSAPCQPHCGSAIARRLCVARWDFISILLTAKRVKSLFKRAGDGVFGRVDLFARRGKSCQNAQAHFDDFPL